MLCDTSVDMQSPDASMVVSSADVSMMGLGAQEDLKGEDSLGMEELSRLLEELDPRAVLPPALNHSKTDEVILRVIEGRLNHLRTLTSMIVNDQAGLHILHQQLAGIHAIATNSLTSTDSMVGPNGLADMDMAWLLTERGCQSILATCVRDWSMLALGWVTEVIHDLDAFDDKVVESMDTLRGRRGDIKNSHNIFLQSGNFGSVSVDEVISALEGFRLDEEIELVLPKRPVFPHLDTGFPFGFLSHEQEEFDQRAKDIHALGISLAKSNPMTTGRWVKQ